MAGAADQNAKSVKWPIVSQAFSSQETMLKRGERRELPQRFAEKS
jgi:hypothetical protein